jgi:hypothetical protein
MQLEEDNIEKIMEGVELTKEEKQTIQEKAVAWYKEDTNESNLQMELTFNLARK